jgi:hypothetical protein
MIRDGIAGAQKQPLKQTGQNDQNGKVYRQALPRVSYVVRHDDASLYRRSVCRRKPRLLPQRIRSIDVFKVARHRFAGKLAPHVLDKAKLPTAIAFRPPILSHHLSSKCLINPLAMGFLNLRCIGKAKDAFDSSKSMIP